MEMVIYMKGLDCPHCGEKIRSASEKVSGVKEANLNFIAKKLLLDVDEGLAEAVYTSVKRITADIEPDVEPSLIEGSASDKNVGTLTFRMKGLDCPDCGEKIRSAVEKTEFVRSAELNLMAERLIVSADMENSGAILAEVKRITGDIEPDVEVSLLENAADHGSESGGDDTAELRSVLLRIAVSAAVFVLGLAFRESSFALWIFLAAYIVAGYDVVFLAVKNILKGRPFDECFLMTAATLGAFFIGEFPEGCMVMMLYQLGEFFQSFAVRRSRKSITALMDIRPDCAYVKMGDGIEKVSPETVSKGEIIVVKPGEKIPLDGIVVSGSASIDTSALTGESVPAEVSAGTEVTGGCVDLSGVIEVRVTKIFGETAVSKILEMVENASAKKAKTERFITRFARWYTPCVVIGAVLLAVIPIIINGYDHHYIYNALECLVVSCPCALVISVPLSFFGGIGGASARGILIKGGVTVEQLAECGTVVFDKTGTLTDGSFEVTEIYPEKYSPEELIEIAAIAEQGSNHPAAAAIMRRFKGVPQNAEITELAGMGVRAVCEKGTVLAGNARLMSENGIENIPIIRSSGTLIYIAVNGEYAGAAEISDRIKPDSAAAVAGLEKMKIKTVMLTGDRRGAAEITAEKLGISEWHAELLPDGKVAAMEEIISGSSGKTIFVGDGINDAPVLMRADAGVAMGGIGSDAAIEAADAVLMTDEPSKLIEAIRISRKTKGIVIQNIVFSLGVKAAVLTLAVLGMATMWAAVFADVGVCLIAVMNSLRARKI